MQVRPLMVTLIYVIVNKGLCNNVKCQLDATR